jgi:hypothetical protein
MKRIRLLVSIIALGLALAPLSAIASTRSYIESVHGVEIGLPQSTQSCPSTWSLSPFAGVAAGTLNGSFLISVCHTPIGLSGATIEGGVFTISNGATTVTGAFAPRGTVTPLSSHVTGSLCTQRYFVSGRLLPSGHFGGTLVHYGFWTGISCNVFFATISGNATLKA